MEAACICDRIEPLNNASKPNSDNLIKLAQLLEADVDTLLGNEREVPAMKICGLLL